MTIKIEKNIKEQKETRIIRKAVLALQEIVPGSQTLT